MKKSVKAKGPVAPPAGPDVTDMFAAIQRQLAVLERKIDLLSVRQPEKTPAPPAMNNAPKPFQRFENAQPVRIMHKAVCADCRKDCEVPFRPSGDRPVYCKDCFAKRKAGGPPHARPDDRPKPVEAASAVPVKPAAKEKPAVKVKPVAKKAKPKAKKKR